MIELFVQTTIYPTENEEIIKKALLNLSPFQDFHSSEKRSTGEYEISASISGIESLSFFFIQTRKQKIVQAFHNYVLDNADPIKNETTFMINKQILTQKYLSLCTSPEESPLGPIYIRIRAKAILSVLEYLFPQTENGKVLEVDYKPSE